ncbi:MAG: 50S ribosomal protein L23, partial [Wenzhouxiangellaceae bacterium]
RQAIEGLFDVKVNDVQIVNVKGKSKSFRMRAGRQRSWKKAYVRVAAGQTIEQLNAE